MLINLTITERAWCRCGPGGAADAAIGDMVRVRRVSGHAEREKSVRTNEHVDTPEPALYARVWRASCMRTRRSFQNEGRGFEGADGRNEPGVDDHEANEVNTHADNQNRQASICRPHTGDETADGDE